MAIAGAQAKVDGGGDQPGNTPTAVDALESAIADATVKTMLKQPKRKLMLPLLILYAAANAAFKIAGADTATIVCLQTLSKLR